MIVTACVSVMCRMSSTRVRRRREFGEVSYTERTSQGNDFESIPTVKMKTRHPVDGSFGNEFSSIYNHCGVMAAWSRNTLKKSIFLRFLRKRPLTGKLSKFCSERIHRDTNRRVVFIFRKIWLTEIVGKIVCSPKWIQYSAEAYSFEPNNKRLQICDLFFSRIVIWRTAD